MKFGSVMPPAVFFLLRIDYVGSLLGPYEVQGVFFQFCEESQWSLDGDSVEFVNYFGQYGHFHELILPNHEHGMFLHLFVFSLISLSSGL